MITEPALALFEMCSFSVWVLLIFRNNSMFILPLTSLFSRILLDYINIDIWLSRVNFDTGMTRNGQKKVVYMNCESTNAVRDIALV